MNLSQRLDQARQKRQAGEVTDAGPTPFDLRMTRDERIYDGRHVRTGEELTVDRWQELRSSEPDDGGLTTWNPKLANEEVLGAWEADITTPIVTGLDVSSPALPVGRDADVIDLRSRNVFPSPAARPPEPTIDLPPWADDSQSAGPDGSAEAGPTCPTCRGHGRLVRLDLLDDMAQLQCDACHARWTDRAAAYAPKGR